MKFIPPKRRLIIYGTIIFLIVLIMAPFFSKIPGKSYAGPVLPLTGGEPVIRDRLKGHVDMLAGHIGERNVWNYDALQKAAGYIQVSLESLGYKVTSQPFMVENKQVRNLVAIHKGQERDKEIIVVGAHYDSVSGSPGANDNATGVAAVLELARLLSVETLPCTVHFVAFVNEEPPFFKTQQMGSLVYSNQAKKQNEQIMAMFSLETIGYYSDKEGSQRYPFPLGLFYPDKGNFIGFVSNFSSKSLLKRSISLFRQFGEFPSEGVIAPSWLPGVDWSDHWAFWENGYPGVMITDTALYRYPHYHSLYDVPENIDYDRLTRVVLGLAEVVKRLAF